MSDNNLEQSNLELVELNADELDVVAGGKGKINTSKIGNGVKGASKGLEVANNTIGIINGIHGLTNKN